MKTASLSKIDHSALKTHQVTLILLTILAFVFNAPWLVVGVSLFLVAGVLRKTPGFGFIYKYGLLPLKWVKPEVLDDNAEPHQFAQLLGSLFMVVGSIALFMNAGFLGWGLVWIVVALAALNILGGFCVGCAVYYWLGRLILPGFIKRPPAGIPPGKRPGRSLE